VPKKIRELVNADTFVLAKGFEKCLFGYTTETWEKVAEQELASPLSNAKARDLKRYLYSGAAELDFDSQGRVVIPETLRKYADLTESAIVIGAGDHFEIWDEKVWQSHLTALEATVQNG